MVPKTATALTPFTQCIGLCTHGTYRKACLNQFHDFHYKNCREEISGQSQCIWNFDSLASDLKSKKQTNNQNIKNNKSKKQKKENSRGARYYTGHQQPKFVNQIILHTLVEKFTPSKAALAPL